MENQYSEPEETHSESSAQPAEVIGDTNMLTEEPVINRAHTQTSTDGPTVSEWRPPANEFSNEPVVEEEKADAKAKQPGDLANPELDDMPDTVKEEGAVYMADFALEAYGEGKRELGNLFIPIKKRRLIRLEESGDVDLDIPLRTRDGSNQPAIEFVNRYNKKATDVFGLRDEFKEEVRPILIKEFAKKGIGLTPWQRVGLAVAMDLKEDIKIAIELRGEADNIVEALKEATAAYKQYYHQSPPRPGETTPPPPPVPDPAPPVAEQHPIDPAQQREENLASEFDHIQELNKGTAPAPGGITLTDIPAVKNSKRRKKNKARGPYKKRAATL